MSGIFQYKKGCLIKAALNHEIDAIGQQCNCFCTMASGIAPQIAKAFPDAKMADDVTAIGAWEKMGNYSMAYSRGILVYNLYGQFTFGTHQVQTNYDKLETALYKMATDLSKRFKLINPNEIKVGFPKLGAGLAGGDWNIIEKYIKEAFYDMNVTIYHLD